MVGGQFFGKLGGALRSVCVAMQEVPGFFPGYQVCDDEAPHPHERGSSRPGQAGESHMRRDYDKTDTGKK